jgi:hypothetical protein
MHLWFSSGSMTEEILKTIKPKDFCFLHPIRLKKNNNVWETFINKNKFDINTYLNNEIKRCKSSRFAVPIILDSKKSRVTHINMVIVDIQPNNIIVEHFEPNGYMNDIYYSSKNISEHIKKLFENIFDTWLGAEKQITFIVPIKECINIQGFFKNTKYRGSCQYVSMLYSLNRVLYPELTRDEIYDKIINILKNNEDTIEQYINDVIYALVDLLNIDFSNIDYNNFIINPNTTRTKKRIVVNTENI